VARRRLLGAAAIAAMLAATGVNADTRLETSNKKWTQMDACSRQSFQKFPDYTVEGSAKRDAYVRDCLRTHRLPPRNDLAQPQQTQQPQQ
jgi:hypothetical protein